MITNNLPIDDEPVEERPCKDCTERWVDIEHHTNCHAVCKKYLRSRAKQDRKLERIYREKERQRGLDAVHYQGKKPKRR